MKHSTLTLLIGFLSFSLIAQNSERTLVKSFNPEGNTELLIDLPGELDVRSWGENFVRVQFTIILENGSERVLKGLLVAGRYHLKGTHGDRYTVSAPGLARTLPQRTEPLRESFRIEVFAPNGTRVTQTGDTQSGVGMLTND